MSLILATAFICVLISVSVNATQYQEDEAFSALYFSYGSYCHTDVLETWDCKWCHHLPHFTIDQVIASKSSDLQAYTGYYLKTGQVVIAFRGTKNARNVMLDLDMSQMYFKDGEKYHTEGGKWAIHKGFYNGLDQLFEEGLFASLQHLFTQHKNANVLITGHSLGGAMAQMLALMFVTVPMFDSISIGHVDIISFGSPRWGSKDISAYFNTLPHTNWRVVNKFDIVPTFPLESASHYGYYHPKSEVLYTKFGTLDHEICDGDGDNSTDCEYNASLNKKYHHTYLGIEDDGCGKSKPQCSRNDRRRSLLSDNCTYVDEWFTYNSTGAVVDDKQGHTELPTWIWLSLVCVAGVLVIILGAFVVVKYKKSKKTNDDEDNAHYLRIDDNL